MIISSPVTLDPPSEAIHSILLKRCLEFYAENPNRKAFIPSGDEENSINFKQIHDYSLALSSWFIEHGFTKGDVILLYLRNCWQFVVCCLGAWSAGLIISPASSSFTKYELRYQLEDSGAKMIITQKSLLMTAKAACQKLPKLRIACISPSDIADADNFMKILITFPHSVRGLVKIDMEKDLVVLPYSSGTSGIPKGVMITHRNYAMMLSAYLRKQDDDYKSLGFKIYIPPTHNLTHLPFYHAMGLFGMLFMLYYGVTQIVMDRFHLKTFLQCIQDYKVSSVTLVPALALLMTESPLLDDYDLSSISMIGCGSAPLSPAIVQRLQKRLPGVQFRQGYGMTELSVASHIASLDSPDGSVGKLMPGTRMKVVGKNGRLCGAHEKGELWISGPQVMKGYWKKPEQTKEVFDSDGFMRTGDIVYYDENGFTYICDRKKELIKVNGKQVAPSEIEAVLMLLPDLSDCCVIGIPDEKYGEIPVAYIVSKAANEEEIHTFVSERLAPYKRLRGGVRFVDRIPRTSTGKLLRREIKEEHMKSMKTQYKSRI